MTRKELIAIDFIKDELFIKLIEWCKQYCRNYYGNKYKHYYYVTVMNQYHGYLKNWILSLPRVDYNFNSDISWTTHIKSMNDHLNACVRKEKLKRIISK